MAQVGLNNQKERDKMSRDELILTNLYRFAII
jgi:hypothetical protein